MFFWRQKPSQNDSKLPVDANRFLDFAVRAWKRLPVVDLQKKKEEVYIYISYCVGSLAGIIFHIF